MRDLPQSPIEYRDIHGAFEPVAPELLRYSKTGKHHVTLATLDCPYCDPACGNDIVIKVHGDRRNLPVTVGRIDRWMVDRDCPARLARKRVAAAERQQRWRDRNPEVARQRTREAVAAHRARKKAEKAKEEPIETP